jgi:hypothetical protein
MAKYELVVTSDNVLSSPLTLTVLDIVGPRGETGPQGPAGPAGSTSLNDLTDVDTTSATTGQLLQADGDDTYSFVTVAGATNTLDDVTSNDNTTTNDISVGGITATSLNTHTIPSGTGTLAKTSDIPTVPTNNNQLTNGAGYITDYTVTQGDVTAHQAALSVTESQISDLGTYLTAETNDLSSAVTWTNVPDANITQSSVTQHQAALSITESQISDHGTYATLVGGTVPASQLPSYVDDVEEYSTYAGFPGTGEAGKIYVDLATGDIYRWSGSAYVQINDAVSSADQATRLATARTISLGGDVTGSASFDGTADITITAAVADDSHDHTIANVDGLQTALDGKLSASALSDTDDLSEGTTNLYYTDARSREAISLTGGGSELSYNNSTGVFSYTSPTTVAETNAVTIEVKNTTGSTIAKGVPVYISGHSGNDILVAPADANDATKMPAIGLMSGALSNNDSGTVTSIGLITGIDLSGFSEGDILYVDTTPGGTTFGGLTNSPPTGETSKIQNLGKVARAFSNGEFVISGPGRSNATPNLDDGDIFIGNGSNQAVTSSLSTEVGTVVGGLSLNADNIGSGTLASARLPDLAVSDFAASAIVTEAEGLAGSDNDTSIPTTAAVIDYVDGSGSVANDATITIEGGTGLVTTAGDFTTNQGSNETITVTHADHATAGTVSEGGVARTLAYGDAFNVPSVTYNAQGHVTSTGTTALTLPASDNTDTTYTAGTGLSLSGTTINHSNSVSSGTVSDGGASRTLAYSGSFNVPSVTYDSEGHVTSTGTTTLTLPASDNTDTVPNDTAITIQGGSANGITVTNGGFTLDQSSGQTVTIEADLTDLRTKIGNDTTSSIGQITVRPISSTSGQLRLQCEDSSADLHLFTLEGPAHSGFGGAYTWKVPGSQGTAGQGIKINSLSGTTATLGYFDVPSATSDLTNDSGYITTYSVTQGDVTAHQGALSITESQISDLQSYLTAETNDLSSAVTWANVPDANITSTSVVQHLSGGTGVTHNSGSFSIGQAVGTSDNVTFHDMTIDGDLTVNGTTTTIDSTTVAVTDSLFKLAKDNTADSLDAGWYGLYNDGTNRYAGIARDASDSGKFILYDGLTAEPTNTVNTAHASFNKATLKANVEGNVTGNVTGSVTGNAATASALAASVNIGGVGFDGSASINLPGVNTTGSQDTTGSAATLTTPRTIDITGVVATGVDFDGSAGINIEVTEVPAALLSGTINSTRLPDLAVSDFGAAAVVTASDTIASNDNDTTLPTSAAVKDYVDANAGGITTGKAIAMAIVFGG